MPMDHYSYHLGLIVLSYFANSSSFTLFLLLGFFLLLGLLAKVCINIQPLEHMNCSCSSYANKKYFPIFFSFFLRVFSNNGPHLIFFLAVNYVVFLNFPV